MTEQEYEDRKRRITGDIEVAEHTVRNAKKVLNRQHQSLLELEREWREQG